jgi:hypothetical protein|tara:strand:- start:2649 stop:2915 length:267 start_codon:yes stop_codon:yes gene_type:complete
MTDEPRTITAEEAIPILQQQNADRLVLLRLHEACNQDITNYVQSRTQQLNRDVSEVFAAQQARNRAESSVIPEEDAEEESEDEDSDSE